MCEVRTDTTHYSIQLLTSTETPWYITDATYSPLPHLICESLPLSFPHFLTYLESLPHLLTVE